VLAVTPAGKVEGVDGKTVCRKRGRKLQGVLPDGYRLLRKLPNNRCLLANDKSRTSVGSLHVSNSRTEQSMRVSTKVFLENNSLHSTAIRICREPEKDFPAA
jgi:hypothetical protein